MNSFGKRKSIFRLYTNMMIKWTRSLLHNGIAIIKTALPSGFIILFVYPRCYRIEYESNQEQQYETAYE